jgi:serine/threonine-protein kinase
VKPSNLFLVDRPRGRLKVLDFGIARSVASFDAQLTDSHALLGSPGYVAPEQLESPNSVNHRADVWSLGVVLFECLTGRRPFEGKNLVELYNRILNDPPRSLRGVEPKLPRALDIVVARCLKKDPAERFESAEALVLALREFAPEAAARCVAYLRALSVPSLEPREAELADVPTGSTLTAAAREVKRPVVPPGRARKRIRRSWALLPLAVLGAGVWLWRNLDRELGAPAAASSTAVSHVVPTVTSALPPRVASSNDPALRLPDSNPSEAPNLSVRRLPASKPAASRDTRAVQTRSHAPLASGKPVRSAAASTNASPVQSVEHPAWAETR